MSPALTGVALHVECYSESGADEKCVCLPCALEADQSVRSMNLLLAAYSTENGAAVGAWVFLEPNDASR